MDLNALDPLRPAPEPTEAEALAARVAALPEDYRATVSDRLQGQALADYLDKIEPLAAAPRRPSGLRTAGAPGGSVAVPAQAVADAQAAGRDPAEWWAMMKGARRYKGLTA